MSETKALKKLFSLQKVFTFASTPKIDDDLPVHKSVNVTNINVAGRFKCGNSSLGTVAEICLIRKCNVSFFSLGTLPIVYLSLK